MELADGPAVPRARPASSRGTERAPTTWLEVTFAEGRYREVKRYCQALGHPRACASGASASGRCGWARLPVGGCRELTARELAALNSLRGGSDSPILHRIR